jgi:hypothetical protein
VNDCAHGADVLRQLARAVLVATASHRAAWCCVDVLVQLPLIAAPRRIALWHPLHPIALLLRGCRDADIVREPA